MALFGLFGEKNGGPPSNEFDANGQKVQPESGVNPAGSIDFINNATIGDQPIDAGQPNPEQIQAEPSVQQPAAEVAPQAVDPASPEIAPAADVDVEAVAANVDQQLAGEGFVPSGELAVQPDSASTATTEQSVAPAPLDSLEAPQTAISDIPEQPASDDEMQKAA